MTTSATTCLASGNRNRAMLHHRGQLESDGWHLVRRTDLDRGSRTAARPLRGVHPCLTR